MPRASFSTSINGSCTRTDSSGIYTSVQQAKFASETITGVHRHKPQGWIPPTPYTFVRKTQLLGQGSCRAFTTATGGNAVSRVGWPGAGGTQCAFNVRSNFDRMEVLSNSVDQAIVDQAIIKARLQMKGTHINLGVAFAERSQTARLVGDTALSLVRSVRSLRRGDWRNSLRALGVINPRYKPRGSNFTEKWLEMQYGWKPLLSDVYGATAALASKPAEDWIVTGKGTVVRKTDRSGIASSPTSSGSGPGIGVGSLTGLEGCFVRIDAVPENGFTHSLASLGITNPLLIAWEVVPFSFVVDWFLPVGSYLDSLDAMIGYGTPYCSISKLRKRRWYIVGRSHTSGPTTYVNEWTAEQTQVYLSRTALRTVPLPTMPRLKDPRSLGHMANALSLLSQTFGQKR